MKWKKARHEETGAVLDNVVVSDAGYRITRFVIAGAEQFRASLGKEFISPPLPTHQQAGEACENHNAGRPRER